MVLKIIKYIFNIYIYNKTLDMPQNFIEIGRIVH